MKFLKRTLFLIAVLTLTLFSTLLPTQRAYAETKPQAPDGYDLVAVQAGDDLAGKKILVYSEYAFLEGFIFRIVLDNSEIFSYCGCGGPETFDLFGGGFDFEPISNNLNCCYNEDDYTYIFDYDYVYNKFFEEAISINRQDAFNLGSKFVRAENCEVYFMVEKVDEPTDEPTVSEDNEFLERFNNVISYEIFGVVPVWAVATVSVGVLLVLIYIYKKG